MRAEGAYEASVQGLPHYDRMRVGCGVLRSHVLETVGRLPAGLCTHITIGSDIGGPTLAYPPPTDSAKHKGPPAARPLHAALLAFVRAPVGTAAIGTAEMRR